MKRLFLTISSLFFCLITFAQTDSLIDIGIKDILLSNLSIKEYSDSMYNEFVLNKCLNLNYNQSKDIVFKWTESDSVDVSNYKFSYKLKGFDENWIFTKNDIKARYTNLDPGKYVFRIMWAKNDVWNYKGDYVEFKIIPPWWKTVVFKIICIYASLLLFVTLIIVIIYKNIRISKLKRIINEN